MAEEVLRGRRLPLPIAEAKAQSVYAEFIKIYLNKLMKEVLMVIYNGIVYVVQKELNQILQLRPFHLLDDVSKVRYSERHEHFVAIKLRDVRKNGGRDHVVFEVANRELLTDFMIASAEAEEDEVVFESNEEFSMLVNSAPVWFSFDDLDRCKREASQLFRTGNDTLTGFVEIKSSKALSYFKALFKGGQASWETKYVVLKGMKLYIYAGGGQSYTKPERILTFTADMTYKELRKAEAGGKEFVVGLTPSKDHQVIMVATAGKNALEKWTRAFGLMKQRFLDAAVAQQEQNEDQINSLGKKVYNPGD